MRKILSFTLFFIFATTISNAQFYKSILPSPAFTDSLHKIISSFKNNFRSIQGNIISAQADVDTYEANTAVPGAEKAVLFRFHSIEDTTASWQGTMYSGESYNEAARIYKNIFRLVNKTHLLIDNIAMGFSSQMEEPTESLRFTASTLKAISTNAAYTHFIAEVEMINSYTGWQVHLNLHNKKADTDKY